MLEGWEVAAVNDDFNEHAIILDVRVLLVLFGVQHAERHEQRTPAGFVQTFASVFY